jgi:PKD repeat protein
MTLTTKLDGNPSDVTPDDDYEKGLPEYLVYPGSVIVYSATGLSAPYKVWIKHSGGSQEDHAMFLYNGSDSSGTVTVTQENLDDYYDLHGEWPTQCFVATAGGTYGAVRRVWSIDTPPGPNPWKTITITVKDAITGAVIPGASLVLDGDTGTSDEYGSFDFYRYAGSSYNYSGSATNYIASGTISTGTITGNTEITLNLSPDPDDPPVDPPLPDDDEYFDAETMAKFSVHVVNSTNPTFPVAGATVTVSDKTRTTDANGWAVFNVWKGYAYTYSATATGYTASTPEESDMVTGTVSYAILLVPGGSAVPVIDFSASPAAGTVPLVVQFTDLSVNTPTSWDWDYGDGTSHGSTQNPSHTYISEGTYDVTLSASNGNGAGTPVTKTAYITVGAVGNLKTGDRVVVHWDSAGLPFCLKV